MAEYSEENLADRCVSDIDDKEGDSTSQGGGGLAEAEADRMSVGKKAPAAARKRVSGKRKKPTAVSDRRRAAASNKCSRQSPIPHSKPRRAGKRRVPTKLTKKISCHATAAADEGGNSEPPAQQPTVPVTPAAPKGSPEQRKSALKIRLRTKIAEAAGRKCDEAKEALNKATAALEKAQAQQEQPCSSQQAAQQGELIAELQQQIAELQQKTRAETDMQLMAKQLISMLTQSMQQQSESQDTASAAPAAPVPARAPVPASVPATVPVPATAAGNPVPANTTQQQTGNYRNAAVAGQARADLEGQVKALQERLQVALTELEEAHTRLATAESRLSVYEGKAFLQALNKPATFTGVKVSGKPTLSVRDWLLSVRDYTDSIGLVSDKQKVAVAESYLGGDAKRDWHTKRRVLLEQNTVITFAVFEKSVIDSWDPACSDLKARAQLESITFKGNITVYISMFDRICSFIPNMTADEKVHKFLFQIRKTHPHVADKLQTDPATKKTWDDYFQLRQYALHAAATDAFLTKTIVPVNTRVHLPFKRKGAMADIGHIAQGVHSEPKRHRGVGGDSGGNRQQQPRGPGGREVAPGVFEFVNARQKRFTRTSEQLAKKSADGRRLCACCFKPSSHTHHARTCTSDPDMARLP